MTKVILKIIAVAVILALGYLGYRHYQEIQEEKRMEAYRASLVDTSSPTVSVLRDSLLIPYSKEKKTLHIYVPPEYATDSTTSYPVIYVMDGESSFNDLENMSPEWQIDEVINEASRNGNQTAIVVGINQAQDRDAEYTPWVNDDNPNAHGSKYAEWVATDLKSWIDHNYRTMQGPASTTIVGISRSGMMAYYMLMAHADIFGNAIIQSPSMWVDHDRLLDMQISDEQLKNKKIFVSVGEYEGNIMIPHAKEVYDKFKRKGLNDNQIRYEIIPEEGHWHPTWRKSFAIAYPWLMQ